MYNHKLVTRHKRAMRRRDDGAAAERALDAVVGAMRLRPRLCVRRSGRRWPLHLVLGLPMSNHKTLPNHKTMCGRECGLRLKAAARSARRSKGLRLNDPKTRLPRRRPPGHWKLAVGHWGG